MVKRRITIYDLPPQVEEELKKYAEARGLSISSAIKSILAEYFGVK